MPPRKSNPHKSDTSTARFVPMEDAVPTEPSSAAPSSTPASAHPMTETVEESPAPATSEKKGKEKEKEKEKEKDNDAVTIEELTLPKSIITRLAKGVLPPNTQIQANAILAISHSTTVFINYLASHANENTVNAGKKTISPADVFKALDDTEFSFLRAPLEAEFAKFNTIQTEKRTSYRQKVRAKKSDGQDTDMPDTSHVETDADVEADTTLASQASLPRAKRARVEPSASAVHEPEDAETEEDEPLPEDDDDDEVEEEEDDDEDEEGSGDETQDALEEKPSRDDHDEALDGDESD